MFAQLDPIEATYLARLIVSISGVLLFLALAVWMIRRKQKTITPEAIPLPATEVTISDHITLDYQNLNPLSPEEQLTRTTALEKAYNAWKAERLLQAEDGRSLFVRAGVEKSGLRYQLVASSQVQAFAILLSILMAENDPNASTQAEALFASLLAHPAYQQSQLSSWKYLPDLPRSPKLDPDPHAEAWLIYVVLTATKRWAALNRFHYSQLITERTQALNNYLERLDPDLSRRLPFSGFLVNQLKTIETSLDWSTLGESQELFISAIEYQGYFESEQDAGRLGFSLFQLGLLAWLEQDPGALRAIGKAETWLRQLVEDHSRGSSTETEFSRTVKLALAVPALLTLRDRELNNRVWDELVSTQPDKNDGLGATSKVLGMAWLAGNR